ncbi:hypothetical protein L9G15_04925 [Shewanella sp. A3A]|nr:hypothetical protein [Shewanella ferrihydritica]
MSAKKWVSLIASVVLIGHAILGLIRGEILLEGGSTIEFQVEPIAFIALVSLEIAISTYVVWAFLIVDKRS